MVTVGRNGENRLDVALSGKLDTEGMIAVLDALLDNAEGMENGGVLFDVVDYHLPSFGAIAIELWRLPQVLRLLRRFSHAAVLADQTWLQAMSHWNADLVPGLTIKTFKRSEKAAARLWLETVCP
ncbi:STAS/SEC14 domain-containing protein [Teredinibacter turnerae]|uniref:STAS/SEC14 domain-containing protein n=1 Tax=Teredinibacter turnerae TaxID=2426 RepID=UPI0030CF400E